MSYIAKVKEIVRTENREEVICHVEFTDGEKTFMRQFTFGLGFSIAQLKQQIRYKIQQLESIDQVVAEIPVDQPIEYQKTTAEIENDQISQKIMQIENTKRLIDLGVLQPEETNIETVKTEVKSLYSKIKSRK